MLGLDPGTATTGFGVLDVKLNKYNALAWGAISTDKNETVGNRLIQIHYELERLLKLHQPDHVVVERLFFAANMKTAMAVSEARGVIIYTLTNLSIPYMELTPMQLKHRITGTGKANKRMVREAIIDILEWGDKDLPKASEDDAIDALAIAACGAKILLEECNR